MRHALREFDKQAIRALRDFPAVRLTDPPRVGHTRPLRRLFLKASDCALQEPDAVGQLRAILDGLAEAKKTHSSLAEIQNVPAVVARVRLRIDHQPQLRTNAETGCVVTWATTA
ncbi:MAG: hypothetical protein KJ070_22155 [Verrucomicrobia bacterium]|nr:hypothetical protein [Verrucomicrobiota bacterium]